jgi:hypothetical protein
MASTNQQIIANLYQVFGTDTAGNIANINIANATISNLTATGNVNLGTVANVHITGGTSGQLLTTNGAGDLSWVTVSAATGNIAGLNLNGNGSTVLAGNGAWIPQTSGNLPNLNGNGSTVLAGNGAWIPASASGNVGALNLNGNVNNYLSGTGAWQPIGNIAVTNYNGLPSTFLNGVGQWIAISANGSVGAAGANSWVQYNVNGGFAANSTFTFDAPNDTVRATKVSADGLMNVHYATEGTTLNTIAPAGTYILDVLSNGVHYTTANATGNLVLNIRGNSTTTINSILSVGNSITATYLLTSGTTGYVFNTFAVDGNSVTPKWAGGVLPSTLASSVSAYTLTVIKTSATPTYTVLASITGYQ